MHEATWINIEIGPGYGHGDALLNGKIMNNISTYLIWAILA